MKITIKHTCTCTCIYSMYQFKKLYLYLKNIKGIYLKVKLDNRHYQTKYLMTFQATVNCSSVKYNTHSCKVDLDPRFNKPIQLF